MKLFYKFFFFLLLILFIANCRKDEIITDPDASLNFSTDTITFDTIFTTIGSTTKQFKIYNPHNRPINITSITLAGGESSNFRLNIDGERAREVRNVEILSKDSLYIFVEVTLDPNNSNNLMVIKDSIEFVTNGNYQDIKLIAFGQDVHLYNGEYIDVDFWPADKPYLIYNSAAVREDAELTIEEGARIYFHSVRSSLLVLGTLKVKGTVENPVVFSGDRLEEFYKDVPGQWGTIAFFPDSYNNEIENAVIENAIAGMQVGFYDDFSQPSVILKNTYIQNMAVNGIYAFGAKIEANNVVITRCGGSAAALLRGGDYLFNHCTIYNNGSLFLAHSDPALVMTNRVFVSELDSIRQNVIQVEYKDDLLRAEFNNSIVSGSLRNEIQMVRNPEKQFNYLFDHCLLKNNEDSLDLENPEHFNKIILNEDPGFKSTEYDTYNLELDTLSVAKDSGDINLINLYPDLEFDFKGVSRILDAGPDLGAYERVEGLQ